jgi:DNA-directed RNA polymerase subunit M/transcription elongation factor TFIIS
MKFCPSCRNMLFGIDEDTVDGKKVAILSCRKCSYKEAVSAENPLVYEHILREDKTARLVLNPYLKNDPTLNHLTNIQCPNEECASRAKSVVSDVVAVKINEKNLIWMYQCVHCDTTWKQASCIH